MSDERSPKPFGGEEAPQSGPTPTSEVKSTEPVKNAGLPGVSAAPLPEVQLKIHDYQYTEQPSLRPIKIELPEEDEEEEESRPMFDAPNTPANWPLWIGALLLMSFFIGAAIWMLTKATT